MPGPNQRTGIINIRIDGILYESLEGAKLSNISGIERTPVVGSAVFGYTEKAVPPQVDAEFAHGPGISVATLMAATNVVATFECDSGPIFVLGQAWVAKATDLTGGQGKLSVTVNSKTCTESGTA